MFLVSLSGQVHDAGDLTILDSWVVDAAVFQLEECSKEEAAELHELCLWEELMARCARTCSGGCAPPSCRRVAVCAGACWLASRQSGCGPAGTWPLEHCLPAPDVTWVSVAASEGCRF